MYIVIVLAIILYLFRVLFMLKGSLKEKRITFHGLPEEFPFVSVIVPARDEEQNIALCLQSLMQSTYPMDKFEVIAVNDMSSDKTGYIMDEFQKKHQNIKPVHLTGESQKDNLAGKPGAIHSGIKQAKGKYILMTDADCIVEKKWIEILVKNFELGKYDLIPSFTLIKGDNPFAKIQNIEWIYMHTMASAGVGNDFPLGCYGNNLSIRRSMYDGLGGYPNIKFSVTEDLALEQEVFEQGGTIHYKCDPGTVVTTIPCKTFIEYMKQKKRWAVGGMALKWKAVIFVLTSMMLWLALFASIITMNWLALFLVIATRLFGDFCLIETSLRKLKLTGQRKWLIPSILFFTIIELVIPFTLLSKKVKWKGRTFK